MNPSEKILWKYEVRFWLGLGKSQAEAERRADEKIVHARELAKQDAWIDRHEARYA